MSYAHFFVPLREADFLTAGDAEGDADSLDHVSPLFLVPLRVVDFFTVEVEVVVQAHAHAPPGDSALTMEADAHADADPFASARADFLTPRVSDLFGLSGVAVAPAAGVTLSSHFASAASEGITLAHFFVPLRVPLRVADLFALSLPGVSINVSPELSAAEVATISLAYFSFFVLV